MIKSGNYYCIFEVDGSCFALSALKIREIIPRPEYSGVPGSCPAVAGLWHEGSEFLPIVRLPFQSAYCPERETQVLVLDGPHGHWGLLVDRVLTVTRIDYSPNVDVDSSHLSTVTVGMSTWEGHSIRVLSESRVYRLSEDLLAQFWLERFIPEAANPNLSGEK